MSEEAKIEKCQLLIIGDSTVGKTSILYSYVDREHTTKHVATTGIDFFSRDEKFGEKLTVKVKIWDTAGQERYRSLTNNYFRNSQGIILVYDISNRITFNNLRSWIEIVKKNNKKDDMCLQNMIIIGNKVDLKREVESEEVNEFSRQNNLSCFEVSAKTDLNIKESIRSLVAKIIKIDLEGKPVVDENKENIINKVNNNNNYKQVEQDGQANQLGEVNTNQVEKENQHIQPNHINQPNQPNQVKSNENKVDESNKEKPRRKGEEGCKCLIF